jgi:hypothetical protein
MPLIDSMLNCLIRGIDRALGAGLLARFSLSTHGNGRGALKIVSSRGVDVGNERICGITKPCSVCVQPTKMPSCGLLEKSSGSSSSGGKIDRRGYTLSGPDKVFRDFLGSVKVNNDDAGVKGGCVGLEVVVPMPIACC